MSKQMEEHREVSGDVRTAALLRLRRRHEFENHAAIYLMVSLAICLAVGLVWQSWYPWSLLPAAAWGIGLAFQAWFTFGPPNQPITEPMLDREIARFTARYAAQPPPSPELRKRHQNYWTAVSDADRTDRLDAGRDEPPRDVTHLPAGCV
jgi:hypothetical protein